jgi:hypothetical protein
MKSRMIIAGALACCAHSAAGQSTDPAVEACRSTGLLALQQRSNDVTDLIFDMDSLAVTDADTAVETVPIKKVLLGEAYLKRGARAAPDKTGAPDRFVCLIGDKGRVVLTFFTSK